MIRWLDLSPSKWEAQPARRRPLCALVWGREARAAPAKGKRGHPNWLNVLNLSRVLGWSK